MPLAPHRGYCAGPIPIPPPGPATTEVSPPAADESQPTSIVTPGAETDAAGEPLAPRPSAAESEAGPTLQPGSEAVTEEVAAPTIVPEETRKRWRLTPILAVGVLHDDNIFLSNTNRVADVIWTFSTGLSFELGDFREGKENYLNLFWVGLPVIYTDNPEQNAFNQSASLFAQYRWNRLAGRIESNFNTAKGPNREVNTITTTTTLSNSLRFLYDYSEKTSFDLGFLQRATLVEGFESTNQYETRGGIDYQLFPKTRVGFEGVAGITDQSSGPLQYYQQARLRGTYEATAKLTVMFSGGIETREFEGTDTVRNSPVFSFALAYQPFDGTRLAVAGYRNVVASNIEAGQNYNATGFEIGAEQRLFQKYTAAVAFGYENDAYFAAGDAQSTRRVDNYLYVRPRLTYNFIEWLSVSAFYEFRQQDSNQVGNSFYNNRVGMEIATKF